MSPIEANVPEEFVYRRTVFVSESVTVIEYFTFERAPKKTQMLPLTPRASRTLTISSTLLGEKNQKYPVSLVSWTGWPMPVRPRPSSQSTSMWKRQPFRLKPKGVSPHGVNSATPAVPAFST